VLLLLVTANVVPSSLIPSNLKMEAIRPSATSIAIRARLHHIPEDGILNSHGRENLKSYRLYFLLFIELWTMSKVSS
jgi:hypothetical protein